MAATIPRVVFDCNIFVQAIANRNSPARKALRLFFDGTISLFLSEAIIGEIHDVLNRPELRNRLPGINDLLVNAVITKLQSRAILITNIPEEYHYERDPGDEMYINFAIVANATHLISGDRDLLDLMTTSTGVARQFRSRYPYLRIMSAADFIAELREEVPKNTRER